MPLDSPGIAPGSQLEDQTVADWAGLEIRTPDGRNLASPAGQPDPTGIVAWIRQNLLIVPDRVMLSVPLDRESVLARLVLDRLEPSEVSRIRFG